MTSPRPSSAIDAAGPSAAPSVRRKESLVERERLRDGGKGDSLARQSGARNSSQAAAGGVKVVAEEEDRIGPYLIGEEIGRGSFATVFKGSRHDTRALVAVKSVIRSKLTSKLLENLESEISILKRITHRNIVELKDCLKTDSHIYLIMAFCSAGDLSIYIRKRGDLAALNDSNQGLILSESSGSISRAKEAAGRIMYPHPKEGGLNETIVRCFLGQLVDAIKFLRSQNVIHRDIKPQNLLLQPAEASDIAAGHPPGIPVLKVADFGFARWLPSQSLAETLCGSPLYMAPEILRYEKYDAKADLWSVGAVLFEMSVGRPPFRALNHVDLLRKIERGEDRIKFPDDKRAEDGSDRTMIKVGIDVKTLIRGLLKRNPTERMNFDEFFREANWVAEGGSAERLVPAEKVSAQYAKLTTSTTTSPTAVSSSSSPTTPLLSARSIPPSLAPIPSEAAFVSNTSLAIANNKNLHPPPSASPSLMTNVPAQSTIPPVPRIPAYIDQERPAFARRLSSDLPSNLEAPLPPPLQPASSIKRAPSLPLTSVTGGTTPRVDTASHAAAVGDSIKTRDFAASKVVVRRTSVESQQAPSNPSSRSMTPIERQGSSIIVRASNSGSMMDDDSVLGRDYVVVEKRTVEINALADELASMPTRDNVVARRPSRGFLSRPLSSLGIISSSPSAAAVTSGAIVPSFSGSAAPSSAPPTPYPPSSSSPSAYEISSTAAFAIPTCQPQRSISTSHPYSLSSSPRPMSFLSSSPRSHSSTIERFPGSPLALVGSPSAAIAKALNMASLKIFGSPADGILLRRSSARKPISRSANVSDPIEDQVLAELEDIAQKALVLSDFADSKIVQILPPTPQTSSPTSLGTPSYFSHVAAREQSTSTSSNPFSPVPTPSPPASMRRTSSFSSSVDRPVFVMASSVRAEVLAAEAMVLYLKALAFLGKGIEKARRHWANRTVDQAASTDFNEAVQWFRHRFNECFDKAEFAKSRSQDDLPESATIAEKLIYDRALEISRAAAVNELRGESSVDCETAYETALWMLYAILDETLAGDMVDEGDRAAVNKFVASISARLQSLRRKIVVVPS